MPEDDDIPVPFPGGPPTPDEDAAAAVAHAQQILRAPTPRQEAAQKEWAERIADAAAIGPLNRRLARSEFARRREEGARRNAELFAAEPELAREYHDQMAQLAWALHEQGRHREAFEACPEDLTTEREFFILNAEALERPDVQACECRMPDPARGKEREPKWLIASVDLPSPLHNRHVRLYRCRLCGFENYRAEPPEEG